MRSILLCLPLLSLSAMSLAQGAAPPSATSAAPASQAKAPPAKTAAKPKMRCETIEETGSRLGSRKVCYDASQFSRDQDQLRSDFSRAQQNLSGKPGG